MRNDRHVVVYQPTVCLEYTGLENNLAHTSGKLSDRFLSNPSVPELSKGHGSSKVN